VPESDPDKLTVWRSPLRGELAETPRHFGEIYPVEPRTSALWAGPTSGAGIRIPGPSVPSVKIRLCVRLLRYPHTISQC